MWLLVSLVSASGGPRTNGGACGRTVNVRNLMNNFGSRTCSTKTSPTCFPLTKSKLNKEAWWEFFTHLFKSKSLGEITLARSIDLFEIWSTSLSRFSCMQGPWLHFCFCCFQWDWPCLKINTQTPRFILLRG